ncbi:MAG: thioredoxin [Bacteroidota bacterium]|nr:thioredoxin [Bacteroidota bacterium]
MGKQTFGEIIREAKVPVLVDFYANWCGPCKAMAPVLEDIAGSMGDRVKILKIDTDTNKEAAAKFSIQGIPTFILFKDGRQVWRGSGAMPRHQLEGIIKQYSN